MDSSRIDKLEVLGRITEMKRMYSVIDSSLEKTQCITVTSGTSGEGKTTVSVGIAIAAAEHNKKVLVVDCNWHSPALHEFFGFNMEDESTEIPYEMSVENFIRNSSIENLDILPAVKRNGNGNNGNNGINFASDIIAKMRVEYDLIIMDTASAFPTNYKMLDPVTIANESDGVVMVALTNVTPRQELKKACTAIKTAGANILGVVANQWQNPI